VTAPYDAPAGHPRRVRVAAIPNSSSIRLQPGWSIAYARDHHPLVIERTSHVTVLFRDLNEARAVYQHALGGTLTMKTKCPGEAKPSTTPSAKTP